MFQNIDTMIYCNISSWGTLSIHWRQISMCNNIEIVQYTLCFTWLSFMWNWSTVFYNSCEIDSVQSINSEFLQWYRYRDVSWMKFLAICHRIAVSWYYCYRWQNIVIVSYREVPGDTQPCNECIGQLLQQSQTLSCGTCSGVLDISPVILNFSTICRTLFSSSKRKRN